MARAYRWPWALRPPVSDNFLILRPLGPFGAPSRAVDDQEILFGHPWHDSTPPLKWRPPQLGVRRAYHDAIVRLPIASVNGLSVDSTPISQSECQGSLLKI